MSEQKSSMSPKQLVGLIAAGFAVPIIGIVLIAKLVTAVQDSQMNPDAMTAEATVARIKPVGEVKVGEAAAPGARSGKSIFEEICAGCHKDGLAGSPKFGDAAAWAPRISKGFDTLLKHALGGFNAMPAKGGAADLTDDEVARAIVYMANNSGGKFPEPKAAGGAAAPAEGAASAAAAPAAASAPAAAAPAGQAKVDGKAIFEGTCVACHGTGVAGAPKVGDKAAWGPRVKQGNDTLYKHALSGFNAMPAKGGNGGLKDEEVKAAVDYMVAQAK